MAAPVSNYESVAEVVWHRSWTATRWRHIGGLGVRLWSATVMEGAGCSGPHGRWSSGMWKLGQWPRSEVADWPRGGWCGGLGSRAWVDLALSLGVRFIAVEVPGWSEAWSCMVVGGKFVFLQHHDPLRTWWRVGAPSESLAPPSRLPTMTTPKASVFPSWRLCYWFVLYHAVGVLLRVKINVLQVHRAVAALS